ncbi:MAG: PIN domain-containing protein [Methylovulum sp.]|nr:PIN domain-containing protein [Methylovulum sp.]
MAFYYFDANALLKYSLLPNYRSEQGVNEVRQLVAQADNTIYYSSLTLLESWNVLFRCYRKNVFGSHRKKAKITLQNILNELTKDLQSSPFAKLDMDINGDVFTQAQLLIGHYGKLKCVGSIDMLHIALIKCYLIQPLIMVSSDKVVKNVCLCEDIGLLDPENRQDDG